ncbi:MAG: phosphodiester glycosidase family protein [Deltaproteobacteria bacterium]|jgi:uncharacterized protein YigE (DUF2233 family)|nr:phosphodiester glycosidase family protein [Deltaproteobacteria bacterium]
MSQLPVIFRLAALAAIITFAFPVFATGQQIDPAVLELDRLTAQELNWRSLAPGLEFLELKLEKSRTASGQILLKAMPSPTLAAGSDDKRDNPHAELAVLRSDPAQVEYTLHMASEDGLRSSLRDRAKRHGLVAAINAGMYLPDNSSNTGYLRSASHTNNGRVVKNFGAFFLAGPRKSGLPPARLLEKNQLGDKLNEKIADYDIVAQNYRLTSGERSILWPDTAEAFSISALGRDAQGRILFIACETPLSPPDFARLILALPLEADLLMYLEGGGQAGLAVLDAENAKPAGLNTDTGLYKVWSGRHSGLRLGGLGGANEPPLPNVLGLRLKK